MSSNNKFECPLRHSEVVKNLLNGKFILHNEELFEVIGENLEFYIDFFKKSYESSSFKCK